MPTDTAQVRTAAATRIEQVPGGVRVARTPGTWLEIRLTANVRYVVNVADDGHVHVREFLGNDSMPSRSYPIPPNVSEVRISRQDGTYFDVTIV